MKKKNTLYLVCSFIFLFTSGFSYGQGSNNDGKWHLILEPYLMLPYMNGKSGVGNLPDAEFSQSAGDIFKNLELSGMLYAEVIKDRWAMTSDMSYMKLGSDVSVKNDILRGDASSKQFVWEVGGMYRFLPWLEAGLAFQLINLKSGLDLEYTNLSGEAVKKSNDLSKTWVDPSLLVRTSYVFPGSGRWSCQFRGNLGGLGIGSDLYWQVQAYAGYRFSRVFTLSLGYRATGVDYQSGSGEERFLYDVVTHGPVFRFGFDVF